jgi:hypothetical protein
MKELFDEQQMNAIVMAIAFLATLISVVYGLVLAQKAKGVRKKTLLANTFLFAFLGPAIWLFWLVYNSIEDLYGLDSLKALGINFLIVTGISAAFMAVHFLIGRSVAPATAKKRR